MLKQKGSYKDKDKDKDNNKDKDNRFDFKLSLLDYGFLDNLVNEWLVIRKNKKASNTETAFNGFVSQVELTGLDKNEVLKTCVERSWSGLKAEWITKDSGDKQEKGYIQKKQEAYLKAKEAMGL